MWNLPGWFGMHLRTATFRTYKCCQKDHKAMDYVEWLAAFRRAGFALQPQAETLAMPHHVLLISWYESDVSPYVAAHFWFDDCAPRACA